MIRDMRQRLWRGQRGFTLVEVILALLVFGLTSTAVVAGLTTASKGSEFAQENYTAVALVRSEVEYIKEQPFVDLPSPPLSDYRLIPTPAGFELSVTAVTLTAGYLQQITVTVLYASAESFSLDAYKVNRVPGVPPAFGG